MDISFYYVNAYISTLVNRKSMLSNDVILEGLKRRNNRIIRQIYIECYPSITKWILQNNGSEDDIDDIFQESMFIVYRKLTSEGINLKCHFNTYLFSICKHLWYQELRRRERHINDISIILDYNDFERDFLREEKLYKLFLRLVNKLETKAKRVLILASEGKSNSEIKTALGFKNNQAVADKKKNSKKKLIRMLLDNAEYRGLMNEIFIDN